MGTEAGHLEQHAASAIALVERAPRRRGRTVAFLTLTLIGAAFGVLSLQPRAPRFVWNFTESVPVGLYGVSPGRPARGDLIAIAPGGDTRDTLNAYGALPAGKVLLKQLSAVDGDTVCRAGAAITINGAKVATARQASSTGRALPIWSGCRTLGAHEILALAPHPLSFDGRYLGPIDSRQIIGVATPLLTFPHEGAS